MREHICRPIAAMLLRSKEEGSGLVQKQWSAAGSCALFLPYPAPHPMNENENYFIGDEIRACAGLRGDIRLTGST